MFREFSKRRSVVKAFVVCVMRTSERASVAEFESIRRDRHLLRMPVLRHAPIDQNETARLFNPESAVEESRRLERGAILEQRRHGTVQVHGSFPLYHPVVVVLETRTQVPTDEGPLRGCSLLDSLRKGRFPFVIPSPTAESGFNCVNPQLSLNC
jgi:hypothetical protein